MVFRPSWRWLFFVKGALTVLVALWLMSILPDFPETKTTLNWLTVAERKLALRRMAEPVQKLRCSKTSTLAFKSTNSKTYLLQLGNRWPGLYLAVTDLKVWWLALMMSVVVMSLSFNAYFPMIVGTLTMGMGSVGHGNRQGHGSNVHKGGLVAVRPSMGLGDRSGTFGE